MDTRTGELYRGDQAIKRALAKDPKARIVEISEAEHDRLKRQPRKERVSWASHATTTRPLVNASRAERRRKAKAVKRDRQRRAALETDGA
jgi:hypothetical protein